MTANETANWYKEYYQKHGEHRNSLLKNKGVTFQQLAFELSVINALQEIKELNPEITKVLDVGCGSGGSLLQLLKLGFQPKNLSGLDLLADRVEAGRAMHPGIRFIQSDAAKMDLQTAEFDLVMESTMFIQVVDEQLSVAIAKEMLRVIKPGGHLLLIDWRYGKPFNQNYLGLSNKRIKKLFQVGVESSVIAHYPAALIPPIGRILSKHCGPLYFLVRSALPFLVGSRTTVLKRL